MRHAIHISLCQYFSEEIKSLGVTLKQYKGNKSYKEISSWPQGLSCREVKNKLRSIGVSIDLVSQHNIIRDCLV